MIKTATPFGIQVTGQNYFYWVQNSLQMLPIDSKIRILLLHESILKQPKPLTLYVSRQKTK